MLMFPGRAYLICADARTGSSLLSAALRGTGRAGHPFEYFVREEIEKPWLREHLQIPPHVPFTTFGDWREHILRAGSEGGGIFGASVHYWQFATCVETFRCDHAAPIAVLQQFFPQLRYVWLSRNNYVAQAISHYVAMVTGAWNSRLAPVEGAREVPYDFDAIHHQVESARIVQENWREVLRPVMSLVLKLTYEELALDVPAATRRVCAHVGVNMEGLIVPEPALKKQAGPWSQIMEQRYRQERAARGLGNASPV